MTKSRMIAALMAALPIIGACAEDVPALAKESWQDGVTVRRIVPEYMGNGLELAVIPTPRQVVYSQRLLEFGKAVIVTPKDYPHASTLRDLAEALPGAAVITADKWRDDLEGDLLVTVGKPEVNPVARRLLADLGAAARPPAEQREGYLLLTSRRRGRAAAVLAGNQPAGDFWAVQTLRQLLLEADGKRYLVGAWMLDWPSFRARGSKEMRNYLPQYKDNFAWGGRPGKNSGVLRLRANFGWHVPYWAPGGALDCSDAYLAKLEAEFAKHYKENGATNFAIKFDDVGVGMKPETKERFPDYGQAICYFMRELDKRAKKIDPACKLYYLPQTYGSKTGGRVSKMIVGAGGLPADTGLCWTGPHVFSKVLEPAGMKLYLDSFGVRQTKGLIYDNYARHRDYFPIPRQGRSPELVRHLDGVFSENSTRLNRITRCDWNWNPEAYDPERALKLACRETAGRDPVRYRAIYEFIRYYEGNREIPPKLPRAEKLKLLDEVNSKLAELLANLEQALPKTDALLSDVSGAVNTRLKKAAKLKAAGYRETIAGRATPTLDGKLDDPCWQAAAPIGDFVNWDQKKWTNLRPEMAAPIPAARQTTAKLLYDDKYFYLGIRCRSDDPTALLTAKPDGSPFWWGKPRGDGEDAGGIWHGPSIEIFLAPHADRQNYYQFVASIMGTRYDMYSGQPANVWNSGWTLKTVAGKNEWTMEAAIPLASFGIDKINPGDVWGMNLCRTAPGRQMWAFVWSPRGFHTPQDFGAVHFK